MGYCLGKTPGGSVIDSKSGIKFPVFIINNNVCIHMIQLETASRQK